MVGYADFQKRLDTTLKLIIDDPDWFEIDEGNRPSYGEVLFSDVAPGVIVYSGSIDGCPGAGDRDSHLSEFVFNLLHKHFSSFSKAVGVKVEVYAIDSNPKHSALHTFMVKCSDLPICVESYAHT